jgi:hypothetical protein
VTDPIDLLLPKLENVKGSHGRFTARCPAHDDRGPSLSVSETDDKMLLIHCFAGCGAAEVVEAVGLQMSDLFPRDEYIQMRRYDKKPRENYRALIERARHAAILVNVFAAQIIKDKRWHNYPGLCEEERIIFERACFDLRKIIDA